MKTEYRHTAWLVFGAAVLGVLLTWQAAVSAPANAPTETMPGKIPFFQVDPYWPKLPEGWLLGGGAGVAIDQHDNVWVIHRPATVTEQFPCCKPAPPVMEFDASGKLLQSWGGPGPGYEWPLEKDEHGIFVDYKDNVWIGARGGAGDTEESQILKFDNKGKFLLQIGHRGKGKGSNDTENLGQAADFFVYPKTNEVFVADGYGNRRVIVFDADTGAYKRHWGGYGNRPDDGVSKDPVNEGPGSQQFTVVHKVVISHDGLLYVADRTNRRIQVFTVDGKFVREQFIARDSQARNGTVSSLAFSADPQQRFLYVADQGDNLVWILERKSMSTVGSFGQLGRYAGQFNSPHGIATDSKGNLYLAEDLGGQRVQKFLFKGLRPSAKP
jgi:DNA-binding beta-propeller fold protein YncE